MTKSQIKSKAEKLVRCYDDGKSIDRYTVVFTGRYRHLTGGVSWYLAMNAAPFHPQGFGQHGEGVDRRCIDVNKSGFAPMLGKSNHLGKRILFADLPQDCRKLTLQTLFNLWTPKPKTEGIE